MPSAAWLCRRSEHAASAWMAQCAFARQFFHVAPPRVRHFRSAPLVSLPVLAGPFQAVTENL